MKLQGVFTDDDWDASPCAEANPAKASRLQSTRSVRRVAEPGALGCTAGIAMSDVFQTQSWALKVPDSWIADDSDEAVAFLPEGVDDAALVVSAFYKNSEITMEEMLGAIQCAAHDGTTFTEVRLGDFAGFHTSYTRRDGEGEAAWRVWCVFCRDVHLYITYNCSLRRGGQDDATVDDMLRTVMCLRPA